MFGFGVGIQRLGSFGVDTLAALNALAAPASGLRPTGFVYADPDTSKNGVYTWTGSAWVRDRGLPEQIATLTVTGGTPNAIVATAQAGVDLSQIVLCLLTPTAANTGAVTLNGKAVKDADGNDLTAGSLVAGKTYLLADRGAQYRVVITEFAAITDIAGLPDALSLLNVNFYNEASFAAASIPSAVLRVSVGVGAQKHDKIRIAAPGVVQPWHSQSADGAWWQVAVDQKICVEIFGAKGDLTFDLTAVGYERTGGTNDRVAFVNALAFQVAFGVAAVVANGNYYIDGGIEMPAGGRLVSEKKFANFIWTRYGVSEIGFWFKAGSRGALKGMKIIGQYDRAGIPKPANNGHKGNIVVTGDFYTTAAHQKVEFTEIEVLLCRAADTASQNSDGSIMCNLIGYSADNPVKIGLHGKTNVASTAVIQQHWGGVYDPASIKFAGATITNGGSGYNSASPPTVTVSGGGAGVTKVATGTAIVNGSGVVTGIDWTHYGAGYTERPTISITGGGGSGATATAKWLDAETDDKGMAAISATYHPVNNKVRFLTNLDNAGGHGLTYAWVASAAGLLDIGKCRGLGIPLPYMILPGDLVNYYAIAEQKELIGKGGRIGFQHFTGCAPASDDADLCFIFSRGTSKFEDYAGTTKKIIRQLEVDYKFDGHDIRAVSGTALSGIRLFGILGKVDLGKCWIYGCDKAAIENEYGVSEVTYELMGSDGLLRHDYVQGGRILGSNTKRGDAANSAASGDDKTGYNADNSAILVTGDTLTTTTTANVAALATTIPIAGFSDDVPVGSRVDVGGQIVFVREFIDNGVPFLITTPIPAAVSSGATVTLDRRAIVDELVGNFESSEFGLNIINGHVKRADLGRVRFTGRHAAWLQGNSEMTLVGEMPRGVGLATAGTGYTIKVDPACHITLLGMRIAAPTSRLTAHLQLSRAGASGPWGTATLIGCEIENIANLASATFLRESIVMTGCTDFNGAPVIVPGKTGNNANGYWVFNDDGTLECWLRNVTTDASGNYTWTFPQAPIAQASAIVLVSPTSVANEFSAQALNSSTTTATVKTWNAAGAAASAGVNLYMKGFWR